MTLVIQSGQSESHTVCLLAGVSKYNLRCLQSLHFSLRAGTDWTRGTDFNKETVKVFFDTLQEGYKRHDLYNLLMCTIWQPATSAMQKP